MTVEAKVESPGKVVVRLTITAEVEDWKLILRDLQSGSYPASEFRGKVVDAIGKIEQKALGMAPDGPVPGSIVMVPSVTP